MTKLWTDSGADHIADAWKTAISAGNEALAAVHNFREAFRTARHYQLDSLRGIDVAMFSDIENMLSDLASDAAAAMEKVERNEAA